MKIEKLVICHLILHCSFGGCSYFCLFELLACVSVFSLVIHADSLTKKFRRRFAQVTRIWKLDFPSFREYERLWFLFSLSHTTECEASTSQYFIVNIVHLHIDNNFGLVMVYILHTLKILLLCETARLYARSIGLVAFAKASVKD